MLLCLVTECRVTVKCFIMLSVIMLRVLVLNVVAPLAASEDVGSLLVLDLNLFYYFFFRFTSSFTTIEQRERTRFAVNSRCHSK